MSNLVPIDPEVRGSPVGSLHSFFNRQPLPNRLDAALARDADTNTQETGGIGSVFPLFLFYPPF